MPSRDPKRITPLAPHVARLRTSPAEISCRDSPEVRIFHSRPAASNPIHSLSGDQKGAFPPAVFSIFRISSESRFRSQRKVRFSESEREATILLPSGEIATWVFRARDSRLTEGGKLTIRRATPAAWPPIRV